MQVIEVTPTAPVNPYAEDIATLAKMTEENENAAGEFVVSEDEVGKTKFKIGKAANAIDKTAALLIEEPGKTKGTVRLVYRLKKRHQSGPRGPRKSAEAVTTDAGE